MDLSKKADLKTLVMKIVDDRELRQILWQALVEDRSFIRAMLDAERRAERTGS
jgi:hypothetical protein